MTDGLSFTIQQYYHARKFTTHARARGLIGHALTCVPRRGRPLCDVRSTAPFSKALWAVLYIQVVFLTTPLHHRSRLILQRRRKGRRSVLGRLLLGMVLLASQVVVFF